MSHDVRPSLKCRTHERTFFMSIMTSLNVSLNCRWISIGFMPCKWRNRIITRSSSNVNVAISVSNTLLQLYLVTRIQRVVQCCHLASPNLKNSHVSSNNFHVSICFHSRKKNRIPYNLNAPRSCPCVLSIPTLCRIFRRVGQVLRKSGRACVWRMDSGGMPRGLKPPSGTDAAVAWHTGLSQPGQFLIPPSEMWRRTVWQALPEQAAARSVASTWRWRYQIPQKRR